MKELYAQLGISSAVYDFGKSVEDSLKERFEKFDKTAEYNQMKVIRAMQKNRVSEACFGASSGYGYNDLGRETLEQVYADTFIVMINNRRIRDFYQNRYIVSVCFHRNGTTSNFPSVFRRRKIAFFFQSYPS